MGLVWPGIVVVVCLVALFWWVLLLAAVLISSRPGWRVRVWWWIRPSDGLRRWQCSRHPFRGTGSKFSGQGKVGKWSRMNSGMPGTSALMELPSPLSCDTYLVLNFHRAPWGNNGRIHRETSFLPFGVFSC